MTNKQQAIETAKEKMTNWITEGTQVRGWYTCEKTGKKFRGVDAADQLAAQDEQISIEFYQLEEEQEQAYLESEQAEADVQAEEKHFARTIGLAAESEAVHPISEENPSEALVTFDPQLLGIVTATDKLIEHVSVQAVVGKPVKLTTINCKDCGEGRTIKVQDVFQVERCEDCQKKHRNKLRTQRRREKKAAEQSAE